MKQKLFIYRFSSIVIGCCFFLSFALVVHSQFFMDEKIPVRGIHFLMGADLDMTSQGMDRFGYQPPQNQNLPQFTLAKDLGEVDVNFWVVCMFLITLGMMVASFAAKRLVLDVSIFSGALLLFIVGIVFNVSSENYITSFADESGLEGGTGLYILLLVSLFLAVYSLIMMSRKREEPARIIEENNLFQELK